MKYFYKEKVPAWGDSTPGAVRLCQRFVNRYRGSRVAFKLDGLPGLLSVSFKKHLTLPVKEKI